MYCVVLQYWNAPADFNRFAMHEVFNYFRSGWSRLPVLNVRPGQVRLLRIGAMEILIKEIRAYIPRQNLT